MERQQHAMCLKPTQFIIQLHVTQTHKIHFVVNSIQHKALCKNSNDLIQLANYIMPFSTPFLHTVSYHHQSLREIPIKSLNSL